MERREFLKGALGLGGFAVASAIAPSIAEAGEVDTNPGPRHDAGVGTRMGGALYQGEHKSLAERNSRHQDDRVDLRRHQCGLHGP